MEPEQYNFSSEMQGLADTLNRLLEINHLKVPKLSRNTGVSSTIIYKMLDPNADANPTVQTLLTIARFFDITLDQLLGKKPLLDKAGYIENPVVWPSIPLISWEDIKACLALSPIERKEKYSKSFKTDGDLSEEAFALMMDEMAEWSLFPAATVLVVDPLLKPQSRDYVLVCRRGEEKPAFRQIIMDGSECYLKFPTTFVENTIIPLSKDWEILGTVKEIVYKKV